MPKLNFAIIGLGKMGKIRYKTLINMPQCRVSWICDVEKPKEMDDGLKFTKDFREVINDNTVDALIVSTPNHLIKSAVIEGLRYGKHVFAEKPPGRNLAELKEMMEVEIKDAKNKLMFGFNHRHHESVLYAKKLIDSGEYGNILWMRGRYGKSYDNNFSTNWRSKKELAGGGIFLDQGIHMLDLFLMMCGDFEEVKAYVSTLYWNLDIEDNVFAIFRNKRGQVASLHSTMTQWRHLFSLEIFLERGYITINGLKTSSNSYGDEAITIAQNRSAPPTATWTQEENLVFHVDSSWRKEMDIFVDAIISDKKISVGNSNDAFKLMRLVDKVYKGQ